MRRHSRSTVAAITALLALALASPASARAHRRTDGDTHRPPATAPAQPQPPQAPTSGTAVPVAPPASVDGTGKGVMSVAAIDPRDVETILGKSVRSSAGEDMGRLVDVVVDRDGRPRAAIIDFGGFLGVGSRKIAVDWGVLKFARDKDKGDIITVELTRDQVKAAPEFKDGSSVVVLGPGAAPSPPSGAANPEPRPQAQEK
jgi:PRC-barrel domain protein